MAKKFVGTPSIYPKLLELRKSKTAELKNNKYLKDTTKLRYYQVVGSTHMILLERMVLGDGTGLGKCENAMTYVPTSKGLLKIKDIAFKYGFDLKEDTLYELPKDFFILSNEGTQKASHLYYNGETEGLKIKTHKGFELSGLSHHPILCPNESQISYKRLERLSINDYACINRKSLFSEKYYLIDFEYQKSSLKDYKYPDFLTEDLAELLGYYVSEGNYASRSTLQITQSYAEVRDRIRFLLAQIFNYKETGDNKEFNIRVNIYSAKIQALFKYLGVNLEGKSEGQVVPHSILESKKSVIVSFLRGYFEGDGSVEISNKIVSCSSKSEELLRQIQILLLMFGIVCRRKKKMVKVKNGRNLYWILYFCGKDIDIFQKEIGFVSERKQSALKKIITKNKNTNDDIIPIGSVLIKQAMSDIINHLKQLPDQKNFSVKGSGWKGLVGVKYKEKVEKYIYKKRRLTYDGLREFLETLERLNLIPIVSNYSFLKDVLEKNIFFDKIVSIEKTEDEFFDLHVPEAHNFTGNGFINHNTLQLIATYTFLLERDPSLKLLILGPKSATYQWEEEFEKFTQGITVRVLTNKYGGETGYAARLLQYKGFNENVLVSNYNPVLEEYDKFREILGLNYMMVADECFEYHTPITLEDGSTELIGKIVTQKKPVKVLCQNQYTGKIQAKRVVNFFRNTSKSWYLIKGERTNSAICSPTHKFFTSEGEKIASELKKDDVIKGVAQGYSDVQKQVVLGSLLGDGGIRYYKRFIEGKCSGIVAMQSTKKARYFFLKTELLAEHIVRIYKQKSGRNKSPVWYLYTDKNPILTDFLRSLNIVNKEGKKKISWEALSFLNPLGLAIWYCDDGSYCRKNNIMTLNTQAFTKDENLMIIDHFKRNWGFLFKLRKDKRKKGYYYISISGDDRKKFIDQIYPFIPKCMEYKTDRYCGSYWEDSKSFFSYREKEPFWDTYCDRIEICEKKKLSSKTFNKYRYNIEVEDNHNYFAGGMLVSNCQAFKNRKTKTHFACQILAEGAQRAYGLSATIIKNGLEEVWGIYSVIVPGLFGNITNFRKNFCRQELMSLIINGKKRKIPKTIGYKNLKQFKSVLDPYFLIRKKEEVASELPKLISRKVLLDMLPEQKELYREALSGILYEEKVKQEYYEISDRVRNGADDDKTMEKYEVLKEKYEQFLTPDGKKRGKLAALTYCQMASNGPQLLNQPHESSKEREFVRLMREELLTDKVIVYTRFRSGIPPLEILCNRNGITYTQIHGDIISDRDRQKARLRFQDDPNCNLIFITQAGSAALNLQAASVLIFYDTPWSYGDLVQTIGRAQRIGSLREHILILHMVNRSTIDVRVLNRVSSKKDLSDKILGETAEGALDFTQHEDSVIDGLFNDILEDADDYE